MTTGHRLFYKEFLCFNAMPCRHMPLLVHTCHILPPSEIDLGLSLAVFAGSGGKYLFHRIGWKGRIWQLCCALLKSVPLVVQVDSSEIAITILITTILLIIVRVIVLIVVVVHFWCYFVFRCFCYMLVPCYRFECFPFSLLFFVMFAILMLFRRRRGHPGLVLHPVSITRFLLRRFSPGAGLLRCLFHW